MIPHYDSRSTDGEPRVPQPRIWLMMLVPVVLQGILFAAYGAFATATASGDVDLDSAIRGALPYLLAVNHLASLALLVWLLRKENRGLRSIGWTIRGSWVTEVLLGIGLGLALYLLKEFGTDSLRALAAGNRPTFTSLFNFRWPDGQGAMLVAAVGLVFVEESIFRGYAIPRLRPKLGTVGAVLASSVVFGLLHWGNGPVAIANGFVYGLIFAGVYLRRGNLVVLTVGHALYNAMVLLT